jgi:hypothetical protein
MEDTRAEERISSKKRYVEPTLTQVLLRPEEAVLGNCKIAGTSGPLQGSCTSPTVCYTTTS